VALQAILEAILRDGEITNEHFSFYNLQGKEAIFEMGDCPFRAVIECISDAALWYEN
jgi:hypothetical protein